MSILDERSEERTRSGEEGFEPQLNGRHGHSSNSIEEAAGRLGIDDTVRELPGKIRGTEPVFFVEAGTSEPR